MTSILVLVDPKRNGLYIINNTAVAVTKVYIACILWTS